MNKKFLLKLITYFFVLLIIFSLISTSVYNAKLPVVTSCRTAPGTVEHSMTAVGELFYEDATQICLRDSFEVLEVFIEKGMTVSPGQELFSVDISGKELEKSALELEILRLDNTLAALARDMASAYTASARESLEMQEREYTAQRDLALARMEKLVAGYPTDGVVRAEAAGIVDRVLIEPGNRIQAGEVCVETHPSDATLYVKYRLSIEDAKDYQSPDLGKAKVQTLLQDHETSSEVLFTETLNVSVCRSAYSEESNALEVVAAVDAPEGKPILSAGAEVTLTLGVYESYLDVLPVNCVRNDSEGDFVFVVMERKSLFGIENYVLRVDVVVTARNAMYAALSVTPGNRVVATSTLPLSTGDTVVVR